MKTQEENRPSSKDAGLYRSKLSEGKKKRCKFSLLLSAHAARGESIRRIRSCWRWKWRGRDGGFRDLAAGL
jgi:hypothetical protein